MLKNEGILPIAQGKKLLVTGPNANQVRCLNGGWSYTWQGSNDPEFVEQYNTIYEALSNKFGAQNVILEQGVTYNEKGSWWDENEPQIAKAVAAASRADIIVACIGENTYTETPGNSVNTGCTVTSQIISSKKLKSAIIKEMLPDTAAFLLFFGE